MLKHIFGILALLSLIACIVYPILFFVGSIGEFALKTGFAVVSAVWFASALLWSRLAKKGKALLA